MRGQFRINPGTDREQILPNIIVQEAEESFLKMMFQNNQIDVPGGADYFIGLCNYTPDFDDTLPSVQLEPTDGVGGYSRIGVARDSVGWPVISLVNAVFRAESELVTFTASGADFDRAFTRVFLCNAATGDTGILYAVSAALSEPLLLLEGESHLVQYEIFLNG